VACLMLESMTPELHRQFKNYSPYEMLQELRSMFEKQARVERFDLIQTFHACKQEEGKSVTTYVLQMKGYVDQLERLGYVLLQYLTVDIILNSLTKDFAGFVRNYNMHNMGKTIGELLAMLIEYENSLPKRDGTPQGKDKQVYIPKPKNHKPAAKEHPAKDDTCHHCKGVGYWKRNCLVYLAELLKKKKKVGIASSLGFLKSTNDESSDQCVSCLSGKMTRKSFLHRLERATDLLGIIHIDVCGPLRHVSRQESATRILNMVSTKKVDKTPYELWYGKVPNLSYLKVWGCEAFVKRDTPDKLQQRSVKCSFIEVSGRAIDLEEIQDEDTSPFEITSKIPMKVEGFEPPQEEVILIRRSERTHRAPNRLCLNVEVEEHSLGGLNEPASYKDAMLDLESNKWIDAMNAKIQSMIDNMVWVLVHLPPSCKTVGSKCIFEKKTDMDGIVHTYKARLVEKGYTQLYGVDYEETFSPIANIRAIRILISIAAYYDYEIWQMDVKTAFLNGYLDEDIYMVQPEGFVDLNHLRKASGGNVTFLILYVDDIIIMGNHIPSLQSVKDYLGGCFAIKDLGEATFILGIKIYRDRSKRLIGLGQNAYMEKILQRYKMDNSKRGHIPMQERLDLNKTQGPSTPKEVKCMQNVPYALAVGSIMYVVRCTRPDVAFA
nr:hypothetical protein [Tanacetum cinerariifolium]